jgi:hypothetical protein
MGITTTITAAIGTDAPRAWPFARTAQPAGPDGGGSRVQRARPRGDTAHHAALMWAFAKLLEPVVWLIGLWWKLWLPIS